MTTTSLLRAMPTELRILIWSGQLQKIYFKEFAALKLLSNAVCNMHNARAEDFDVQKRFFMQNEGIHALSLGVLYLHGVLPTGLVGHRGMAMQLACEAMHLPTRLTNDILYANAHRELIAYGSTEPVQAAELHALFALGEQAVEQARYMYPDWFN
jgi:hypothetical protein